jgi:hypothetical protein
MNNSFSSSSDSFSNPQVFGSADKPMLIQKIYTEFEEQLMKVKHPNFSKRAKELTLLTELISELKYEEYRLLVGTLNAFRKKNYHTWCSLLADLALFKQEGTSFILLLGVIDILEKMALAELQNDKLTPKKRIPLKPEPQIQTPSSFCINLMFLVRLFYPRGVNILNPHLFKSQITYLDDNHGVSFKTKNRLDTIIIKPSTKQERLNFNACFSLTLTSPYRAQDKKIYIRANEELLIGRHHLVINDLMGFPFAYKAQVQMKVDDPTWSRASLLISCNSEGHLYLFDRASLNPVNFELFNLKHYHTNSLIYDPRVESATPLKPNQRSSISLLIGQVHSISSSNMLPNEVLASLQDEHLPISKKKRDSED